MWFSSGGIDFDILVFLIAAKIDVNVDFTHKLCTSLMFPAFRFALIIHSLTLLTFLTNPHEIVPPLASVLILNFSLLLFEQGH